jgi:hypothetical protein
MDDDQTYDRDRRRNRAPKGRNETGEMWSVYPPDIRRWLSQRGGLTSQMTHRPHARKRSMSLTSKAAYSAPIRRK